MAMSEGQPHAGGKSTSAKAPKQQNDGARLHNKKNGKDKKKFEPYHARRVPKEADLERIQQQSSADVPLTTLMLRNIPHKYTQNGLLQEIDKLGFEGTYDFFYLPMDVHNHSNVGYAFINFIDPVSASLCYSIFSDYKFKRFPSRKICAVSIAHLQGLEANLKHFQQKVVMNARNNQYRPVVICRDGQAQSKTLDLEKALFNDMPECQPSADMVNQAQINRAPLPTDWAEWDVSEKLARLPTDWAEWDVSEKVSSFDTYLTETVSEKGRISSKSSSGLSSSEEHAYAINEDLQPEWLPEPPQDSGTTITCLQQAIVDLLRQKDLTDLGLNSELLLPPPGLSKLQKPPGRFLKSAGYGPIGSAFEPDDNTPRTNHVYLTDLLGPAEGSINPAILRM